MKLRIKFSVYSTYNFNIFHFCNDLKGPNHISLKVVGSAKSRLLTLKIYMSQNKLGYTQLNEQGAFTYLRISLLKLLCTYLCLD